MSLVYGMRPVLEFAQVSDEIVNITFVNDDAIEVAIDCTVQSVGTKGLSISKNGMVMSVDINDARSVTFKARRHE